MSAELASQVERVLAGFAEANGRLTARLESATAAAAEQAPASGGWSAAQVADHVATFNRLIASLVSGQRPGAVPAPDGFVERPWPDIVTALAGKALEAPRSLHPPGEATRAAGLAALGEAAAQVAAAFQALTPDRAALTITHPRIGTITVLQAGDWIVSHTIRHNAQMKRILAR
jgi:uncharacterized damage-inducible protein DinB